MNLYLGTYSGQLYMLSGLPTNLNLKRKNQISDKSIRVIHLPEHSNEILVGGFEGEIVAVDKYSLVSTKQTKQPKGIINCMSNITDTVVAVGHQNGLVRFWDWKSWNLRKQIRQHKKPVRDFHLSENGIVFGSVASKSLILWDTERIKSIFHYKLEYDIDYILIDNDFEFIFLINQRQIHQIKSNDNEQVNLFKMEGIQLIQNSLLYKNYILIGGDKGSIFIWNVGHFQHKISFKAHNNSRVKCMKIVSYDDLDYLITASTNGEIRVWDILQFLKEVEKIGQDYDLQGLEPLQSLNIGQRVLCMEFCVLNYQTQEEKVQNNQQQENDQQQPANVTENKHLKKQKKKNNKSLDSIKTSGQHGRPTNRQTEKNKRIKKLKNNKNMKQVQKIRRRV